MPMPQMRALFYRKICYDGISRSAGTVRNSLPDHLQNPAVDSEQFRRDLKTYLFSGHSKR